ncbi:MAG TPA: pilus assembly protein PilM [Spirochaetota bacterium]|nr:pilus assembly protein PilM [Spirochaetota bacterium]HPI89172.1 pilus assembly protein PilM [Spirochaetota bacterium]HPR46833.1 pilus assembly protein PilM [Spirochaetota bacterium]
MFENLAALDIGTSSIKALAIKTGFKDFQIKSLLFENIDMAKENRAEAVQEALLTLLEDESLKGCRFITMIPVEQAVIRNISFPFSDMKKIADAVPFEAEEDVPFPLEDLIIDFQPLNDSAHPGRIMIGAVKKSGIAEFIAPLKESSVDPIRIGLESNALFECYRYFNTIPEENIIQLHIGHQKTIVNIILNGRLMYTRAIAAGSGVIIDAVSDALNQGPAESERTLLALNLDLMSYENNTQRETYKSLGIAKSSLKEIFTAATEMTSRLLDELNLTIKAFHAECGEFPYNRILISGGGSCMTGIGSLISRELNIPVVAHPFLENHRENNFNQTFQVALGALLAYLNKKSIYVDFLKQEFASEAIQSSRRMYFLAGGFGVLSLIVLLINLIASMVMSSTMNTHYDQILKDHYKRYFKTASKTDNPIAEAMKLLNKEKKDLKSIEMFITPEDSIMDMLNDMLLHFPESTNFTLKNMIINERIIRIDGTVSSSQAIDDFKERIKQTGKYDSVTMNIKSSRKDEISFNLTIKLKIPDDRKRPQE